MIRKFTLLSLLALLLCCLPHIGQAQVYLNFTVNQAPQLIANAGPDTTNCNDIPIVIGSPNAGTGGTSPISYSWSPITGMSNGLSPQPTINLSTSGSFTYTLFITDINNCTDSDEMVLTIDPCLGIENATGIQAMNIFPNPNEGKFTISSDFDQVFAQIDLSVVDLQGRIIWETSLKNPGMHLEQSVTLQNIARGTYTVLLLADGQKVSRNLIIR